VARLGMVSASRTAIAIAIATGGALAGCGSSAPSVVDDGGAPPGSDAGAGHDSGTLPVTDAGPRPDGAPVPVGCGEPDTACPAELPFTSGRCAGSLVCEYSGYQATCTSAGLWNVEPQCDGVPPGGACLPPLIESCDSPFAGTLAGASIRVGPFGEDRAFAEGELVPVVFGSQGGAMIAWTLHVDGVETPPECVEAEVMLTVDESEPYVVTQPMTLHCGHSLMTLQILSDRPCEIREYAITMVVRVAGIGEQTLHLRTMGMPCPRGGG
jgi:hypothetical protein